VVNHGSFEEPLDAHRPGLGRQDEVVGRAGLVVSVEIDPATLVFAAANLDRAGYTDVVRVLGDGALGHPALAPYDRICITAACREPPAPLLEQLRAGGRLIAPIQRDARQVLTAIEKQPDGLHRTSVCEVLYVSLQGPFGTGPAGCAARADRHRPEPA
jgi:protein-L-isoaspartate(D-aspartate) O-methyltransferase